MEIQKPIFIIKRIYIVKLGKNLQSKHSNVSPNMFIIIISENDVLA